MREEAFITGNLNPNTPERRSYQKNSNSFLKSVKASASSYLMKQYGRTTLSDLEEAGIRCLRILFSKL
jgi:hypothetical protein